MPRSSGRRGRRRGHDARPRRRLRRRASTPAASKDWVEALGDQLSRDSAPGAGTALDIVLSLGRPRKENPGVWWLRGRGRHPCATAVARHDGAPRRAVRRHVPGDAPEHPERRLGRVSSRCPADMPERDQCEHVRLIKRPAGCDGSYPDGCGMVSQHPIAIIRSIVQE